MKEVIRWLINYKRFVWFLIRKGHLFTANERGALWRGMAYDVTGVNRIIKKRVAGLTERGSFK